MRGELDAGARQGLVADEAGLVLEVQAVEGERHVGVAVGRVGHEGRGGGDGAAVGVEVGRGRLVAGAVYGHELELAGHGVLAPVGDQPVVLDAVDERHLVVDGRVMVLGGLVGERRADRRALDLDGLALVGEVLVLGDDRAEALERLVADQVLAVGQRGGVEGELDVHGAGLGCRGEGLGRRDGLAVGAQDRRAGGLAHELEGQRVARALAQVGVADGVGERRGRVGLDGLGALGGRLGADPGRERDDGLLGVVLVGVLGDVLAVPGGVLVDHHVAAGLEQRAVEGELELDVSVLVHRRELLGGGDGRPAAGDGRAVVGVVQLGAHLVGATGHEVLVGHAIDDLGLLVGDDAAVGGVAGGAVIGAGVELGLHVVEGAQVELAAVVGGADGELVGDQLAPLVGLAGQLDELVSAVGQGAEGLVADGRGAVVGQAEPHAGARARVGGVLLGHERRELVLVDRVAALGVAGDDAVEGVDRPALRRGVDDAVLVGHDDVALELVALGVEVDEQEGHAGHGLLGRVVLLLEQDVGAGDLVDEGMVAEVDGLAVGADLELDRLGGAEVARRAPDLLDLVGAVGQQAVGGAQHPAVGRLLGGRGVDDVVGLAGAALDDDGVPGLVDDRERGGQVGVAGVEGPVVVGLLVALLEQDVAAHDVVGRLDGVHLAVLADLDGLLARRVEHRLVGRRLLDAVGAVGQVAGAGGRRAGVVGDDGLHEAAGLDGLAVLVHDGVVRGVVDGELDAREPGVALGLVARDGVELEHAGRALLGRVGLGAHVEHVHELEVRVVGEALQAVALGTTGG